MATVSADFTVHSIKLKRNDKVLNIKLQFWDTAGQDMYKQAITKFYKDVCGVVIVYDITVPSSFEQIDFWIRQAKGHCADDIQIILVANKSDQAPNRKVDEAEGQNVAQKSNALFIEASALSGDNVKQAFELLVNSILKQKFNQQ